jgi:hypothetical protein
MPPAFMAESKGSHRPVRVNTGLSQNVWLPQERQLYQGEQCTLVIIRLPSGALDRDVAELALQLGTVRQLDNLRTPGESA